MTPAFESFLIQHFLQLLLLAFALLIGILGIINFFLNTRQQGERAEIKIKGNTFTYYPGPRLFGTGLMISGLIIFMAAFIWFAAVPNTVAEQVSGVDATPTLAETATLVTSTPTLPAATEAPGRPLPSAAVSLSGIQFMYGDWDPRSVDLRTAAEDGIPISRKDPLATLAFFDVQVVVSPEGEGLQAEALFFINDEQTPIGVTEPTVVKAGVNQLKDPVFNLSYLKDSAKPGEILILPAWNQFRVKVRLLRGGDAAVANEHVIRINPAGASWFTTPPAAQLIRMEYSINQSPRMVLDLAEALATGLNVYPEDTFQIHSVTLKTRDKVPERTVHVEAYLTNREEWTFNNDLWRKSPEQAVFQKGVTPPLALEAFIWTDVAPEQNTLALSIMRDDDVLLDRYEIPLQQPNDAALYAPEAVLLRDPQSTEYLDFEIDNRLQGFTPNEGVELDTWTVPSVSGRRSLVVKITHPGPQTFFWKATPKNPSLIVGHIFWPAYSTIKMNWAILCETDTGQCVDLPFQPGQWTTFHLSLAQLQVDGQAIDRSKVKSFFIRAEIEGDVIKPDNPAVIYIDDLVTYFNRPE